MRLPERALVLLPEAGVKPDYGPGSRAYWLVFGPLGVLVFAFGWWVMSQ